MKKLELILSRIEEHQSLKNATWFVGQYVKVHNIPLFAEADDKEFPYLSKMVEYIQFDLKIPLTRDERDKNEFLRKMAKTYIERKD